MSDYECPKCNHEYEASGSYEDDHGEQECENCGFQFIVEIEYDPSYSTRCVTHEWGEVQQIARHSGKSVNARLCIHCRACDLKSVTEVESDNHGNI